VDIEKLVEFVPKYLSEYAYAFAETFRQPSLTYAPVSGDRSTFSGSVGDQINPQLLTFAILSIVLGLVLRQVLPTSHVPVHVAALIALIVWFVLSAFLHLLLRLVGGTGTFVSTVSVAFHVFLWFMFHATWSVSSRESRRSLLLLTPVTPLLSKRSPTFHYNLFCSAYTCHAHCGSCTGSPVGVCSALCPSCGVCLLLSLALYSF
jgi:Yip1 domain